MWVITLDCLLGPSARFCCSFAPPPFPRTSFHDHHSNQRGYNKTSKPTEADDYFIDRLLEDVMYLIDYYVDREVCDSPSLFVVIIISPLLLAARAVACSADASLSLLLTPLPCRRLFVAIPRLPRRSTSWAPAGVGSLAGPLPLAIRNTSRSVFLGLFLTEAGITTRRWFVCCQSPLLHFLPFLAAQTLTAVNAPNPAVWQDLLATDAVEQARSSYILDLLAPGAAYDLTADGTLSSL